MYAGYLLDWGEEVTQYFQTSDWIHFHDIEGTPIDSEVLQRWALWLNSPWSYAHEKYNIEFNLNLKDDYSVADNFKEYPWRCYLEVVGYDGACGVIYGYGKTPEEAMLHCKAHNMYIQSVYNPEKHSV